MFDLCIKLCENFNPTALKMAKTLWSFGCSECDRVKLTRRDATLKYNSTSGQIVSGMKKEVAFFFSWHNYLLGWLIILGLMTL